jgi:hypothetical protein
LTGFFGFVYHAYPATVLAEAAAEYGRGEGFAGDVWRIDNTLEG